MLPLACWSQSKVIAGRQTIAASLCFIFLFLGTVLVYYYSTDSNDNLLSANSFKSRYSLEQMREFAFRKQLQTDYKRHYYNRRNLSFNKLLEGGKNCFDISGDDVLVVLHIQKTAGTSFERWLTRGLQLPRPCSCVRGRKRCNCPRPRGAPTRNWLFSRFSTGWPCGLHADYTELAVSGCVDYVLDKKEGKDKKRRYFYVTFLREPMGRFVSEYSHVARGATWLHTRLICNGQPPSPRQLPSCFDPDEGWTDVSLDEFLSCPFNLAFNRQTRMLSDLTLVNCYDSTSMDPTTRNRILLESAKKNLKSFAFFGLKERMADSQWMFERLFALKSTKRLDIWTKNKSNKTQMSESQMEMIKQRNELDIKLYNFAVDLFEKRLKVLRMKYKADNYTREFENRTLKKEDEYYDEYYYAEATKNSVS